MESSIPTDSLTTPVAAVSPTPLPAAESASTFDPLTTIILPAALLLTAVASFTFMPMIQSTRFLQWLQRKRYQYEITFSLYMMTPTEKFVINSLLFLLLSWLLIAASLYLPEHLSQMSRRMLYYISGSDSS